MTVHQHPRLAAHQAALGLAARGFYVFPCRGENKRPCTPHGFHDAVAGTQEAAKLFDRHPGELVGMPTGPLNGFDVLDIDPRHGGDVWESTHQSQIPRTRVHQTRSGGRHYFFRHHPGVRNSESKIAQGVDTRGEGGYIIAWHVHGCPVLSDAPLADWPEWLLDILLPKPAPAAPPTRPFVVISDTRVRRTVQRCLDRVQRACPGERHYALRRASYAIGGLLGADIGKSEATAALLDAVRSAGGEAVDEKNALATIKSGLEKGEGKPFGRCA